MLSRYYVNNVENGGRDDRIRYSFTVVGKV